eukprot:990916-Rhodomonas_salina.4
MQQNTSYRLSSLGRRGLAGFARALVWNASNRYMSSACAEHGVGEQSWRKELESAVGSQERMRECAAKRENAQAFLEGASMDAAVLR